MSFSKRVRTAKHLVSLRVREIVMRHYMIPYSSTGVEPGILASLGRGAPINYVDVGASDGAFADALRRYCGFHRALLVEPQPSLAAGLSGRFGDDAQVRQLAVSDLDGTAEMDIFQFHYSSSLLPLAYDVAREVTAVHPVIDLNVRERVPVKVRTLDGILSELAWNDERVHLLKVDVQGGELAVFRGARETLSRTDRIWTEVAFRPMYQGAPSFSDIYSFLYDAGFVLTWLSQGLRGVGNELLEGDALFSRRN